MEMELKLAKNFSGIFAIVCWCTVFYVSFIFLSIFLVFIAFGLISQIWSYSAEEFRFMIFTFPICSLMLLIAIWISKRFPVRLKIVDNLFVLYYAIPFVKLKYPIDHVKFDFKIGNFGFEYGKAFYFKTKLDPLPVGVFSKVYIGDWDRIQDFVWEINKNKKRKVQNSKQHTRIRQK